MATQKPDIRSVKNNIIEVALPDIADAPSSYLTAEVAAGGLALTVADNSGLANGDYLVLGDIGQEKAEIVKIDGAVTYGTALTITATVFPHGYGTKITLIRYNQVAVYGSSSASDAAPTIIGSAVDLDVGNGVNTIVATTTYTYYYARYYNEGTTTYSQYSTSVAATGLPVYGRGELKKEFLSIYNEEIDNLITDDWLNRAINRWHRELTKRREHWSFLRKVQITDLTEDVQAYDLPTDIEDTDSVISVKVYNDVELMQVDQKVFTALTYDHIGTTVSTDASLGATSLVLSDSSDFTQQNGTVYCKGVKVGYTLNTESTGTLSGITTCVAITAFADAGSGVTTVTAAGHGLSNGDTAYIGSTRNYDGEYTVSGVAGNDFNITKTYVANDATGAVSTVDDSITEALSATDEVWQVRTAGQPVKYLIDPQNYTIRLYPIPDATFNNRNLVIEYWKKFATLDTDVDESIFPHTDNLFLYLNYQLAIRRRLSTDEIFARKAEWKDDLENLVVDDPDYREVRIGPRNYYNNPY